MSLIPITLVTEKILIGAIRSVAHLLAYLRGCVEALPQIDDLEDMIKRLQVYTKKQLPDVQVSLHLAVSFSMLET
jgi:hypothetical protein